MITNLKTAKAISKIISYGIDISLININESDYGFYPDVKNNRILYGLKALSNINSETIEKIKAGRPYVGIKDFMNRCPLTKTAMINLIKAGAFDEVEKVLNNRKMIMAYYISKISEPKKRLTLQNWNGLVSHNLVPKDLELQIRVYNFTKYLKAKCKVGQYYQLNQICIDFLNRFLPDSLEQVETINGAMCILQNKWDKIYQAKMDVARGWLKENQEEILKEYNLMLFKEVWDKYASGTESHWEMESLCFYHGEHELKNLNYNRYNLSDFNKLNSCEVDYFFKRGGRDIPIYKLFRIAGTVIAKDDNRHSIALLTTTGVVNVKFSRDHYAKYKQQISEIQPDGSKKVVEKGWFKRGTMLMLTGYRIDDMFKVKTYSRTVGHQVYKINSVIGDEITLQHERFSSDSSSYENEDIL